jgi:autotransporter translocation and assembly factor TamB
MSRLLQWIVALIAIGLFIVLLALAILQMPWTKDKMRDFVFSLAEKEGAALSIDVIEGDPPFKWTFHNVHLKTKNGDTVNLKTLRLRIAILPLLRREVAITYSHVDEMLIEYQPGQGNSPKMMTLPWSLAFKSLKIENLEIVNQATKQRGLFSLQAKGKFKRKGKAFFFDGRINGEDLGIEIAIQGNKRAQHIASELKVDVKSQTAFVPFATLPVDTSFSFEALLQGPWKTWKGLFFPKPDELFLKPLKGEMKLDVSKLDLPELKDLDQSGFIETSFDLYANQSFEIRTLSLKSDLVCLKGSGNPNNFSFSFLLPHLSRLAPHLGGILTGNVKFDGLAYSMDIESSQLEVGAATYTSLFGKLEAEKKHDLWSGSFNVKASHPTIPLEGHGEVVFSPHRFFTLKSGFITLPDTHIAADVHMTLPNMETQGGIVLQSLDLSHFAPLIPDSKLKGVLGGKIDFRGHDMFFYGTVKSFQYTDFLTDQCSIQGQITDLLTSPKGEFALEGATSYIQQFFFDGFSFKTSWEKEGWPFSLKAVGKWKDPFTFVCSGKWNPGDLQIDVAQGTILQKPVSLKRPFSIQFSNAALVISECHFDIADGYFLGSLSLSPQLSKIHMKAEHFPIDLFALSTSRFTLSGNSSLEVILEGAEQNLQGRINLLLEGADILQSGKKVPIKSKGSIQANIDNNVLQVHSNIAASGEQFMELTASLPITYQLYPLKIGLERAKPIAAALTFEGYLEEIFDFINIGSHRISGLLSTRLLLAKTLAAPSLLGTLSVQNGSYENYFTGMVLQEIQLEAVADHNICHISELSAKDGDEGHLSAQGTIHFQEKLPFSFDAKIESLKILQFDWLSVACSGPVTISGTTESALAKGEVTVTRADISIPDTLPLDLPVLPVTYVNQPPHLRAQTTAHEPAYPFNYDTIVHAKEDIFLTGRGLNSELKGDLHVTGKNVSVNASGTLEIVKGKFSFGGKEFTLTQGELTFGGAPYLNISGTASLPDLTITAILRGPLTSPALTFQSSPPLPTSSIVARILFNKDVSELTAIQALQLADTIVTLSGGAGPNVLESIRKSLGVDRLNFTSSEGDGGRVAVQIGKYLTEGVMVTLSQSTEGSQVIVEVELKGGFILQAETQEDQQGKFSLKWNKNY